MVFKDLHNQKTPLLIGNVWDVASTQITEKSGFQAVGTSSAAIARMLGYDDGENISFSELSYLVERIVACTALPVTVDLESGYSREPSMIVEHITKLADLGVVGINIEDSIAQEQRKLIDAEAFTKTIFAIKKQLQSDNTSMFLNVRTDAFLLQQTNALEETLRRTQLFAEAGADGIFIPGIEEERDIETVIETTSLPINVMCTPNLPNFKKLQALGVRRISMGNFLFDSMYEHFGRTLNSVINTQSFNSIFEI